MYKGIVWERGGYKGIVLHLALPARDWLTRSESERDMLAILALAKLAFDLLAMLPLAGCWLSSRDRMKAPLSPILFPFNLYSVYRGESMYSVYSVYRGESVYGVYSVYSVYSVV